MKALFSKQLGLTTLLFASLASSTGIAGEDVIQQPTPAPSDSALVAATIPPATAATTAAPVPSVVPSAAAAPTSPGTTEVPAKKPDASKAEHKEKDKHWYEKLLIRGYMQVRYNRLLETNEDYVSPADKSIGKDGGFLIRRARLILQGDVHPHVGVYLQGDFASGIGDITHAATIRDWYADINIDRGKEFRFRIGQSKIPYGFENMQSSQNRAPIDRADALNSAVPSERDLGVMFYWTPAKAQKTYKMLVDDGLKGSGNYGVAGLGVYNGQGLNVKEKGMEPHLVARLAYPFHLDKQILELGGGGYTGKYYVKKDDDVAGTTEDGGYTDARVYGQVVLYPQPIGFQAEFTYGTGPQFKDGAIRNAPLHGGYVMLLAHVGKFFPFVRAQYYQGVWKTDTNVPQYNMKELEFGTEFQPVKNFEIALSYMMGQRPNLKLDEAERMQNGRLLRVQLQVNY